MPLYKKVVLDVSILLTNIVSEQHAVIWGHNTFHEIVQQANNVMGECNTILRAYTKYRHLG